MADKGIKINSLTSCFVFSWMDDTKEITFYERIKEQFCKLLSNLMQHVCLKYKAKCGNGPSIR